MISKVKAQDESPNFKQDNPFTEPRKPTDGKTKKKKKTYSMNDRFVNVVQVLMENRRSEATEKKNIEDDCVIAIQPENKGGTTVPIEVRKL